MSFATELEPFRDKLKPSVTSFKLFRDKTRALPRQHSMSFAMEFEPLRDETQAFRDKLQALPQQNFKLFRNKTSTSSATKVNLFRDKTRALPRQHLTSFAMSPSAMKLEPFCLKPQALLDGTRVLPGLNSCPSSSFGQLNMFFPQRNPTHPSAI